MNRNKGPHTDDGGKQVDTESLFDWVDGLLIAVRYSMILTFAVCLVTAAFYYFWG